MEKRSLANSPTIVFTKYDDTTTISTYKCGACAAFWGFYRYWPGILTRGLIRRHYRHLHAAHGIPAFTVGE